MRHLAGSLLTALLLAASPAGAAVLPLTGTYGFTIGLLPPEPGTLLLLGTGVAWLAAMGRNRRRA